ncbi:hypothetical protein ACWGH2_16285 [Streptomyces sp. NPDC054871]
MAEPSGPQPQAVAVELLTIYFGDEGIFGALKQWETVKQDWAGHGDKAAIIGLLEMNERLFRALAEQRGVSDHRALAAEFLRQLSLNQPPPPGEPDPS